MAGGKPLFETDVPCLHCGYNLRGTLEARCPECGKPFIRRQVLKVLQQRRRTPQVLWVIRNVHLRPTAFWSDVAADGSEDARSMAVFPAIAAGLALAVGVAALLRAALVGKVPLGVVAAAPFQLTLAAGLVLGVVLVLAAVHRILVSLVLSGRSTQPWVDAWFIVGYAAAWLVTVLPLGTAGLFSIIEMGGRPPAWSTLPIARVICLCCTLGLLVLLFLWSLTLYEGGRRVSRGSHRRGVLCALANPFLWLLGWAAEAMAAIALWG